MLKPKQPANALVPIFVTLLGMVKELKEQFSKAFAPIVVTVLGIVIFFAPVFANKLFCIWVLPLAKLIDTLEF